MEVLKLLQKSYHGKIKIIYIDPPYNTGKDFVYKDNFRDNLKNYLEVTGQLGEEGQKLSTNSEMGGRYHSDWLNMMYPRLKLARNLLIDDGVIFISIDDNEQANLKKICDEIFGEENFVAQIVWERKRGRDNSARWFSKSHEYIFLYAKKKDIFNINLLELNEETKKAYKNPDKDPRGDYRMLATWARGTQGGVKYDFIAKNGTYFSERLWLFSKENLTKLDEENKLIFRGDNIYRKLFITENKGKIPETIWTNVSNSANASDEIKEIFEGYIYFDTAKPIPLLRHILKIVSNKNDFILDFFSGSSTTAHSVMQLNAEDGGNRKYIMVQLPEACKEDSEAYKAGYKNICEIGKERIRRAGKKIKSDESLPLENKEKLDIGFKVFKLDSSNIKEWDSETEDLKQSLFNSIDNIKSDRTSLDVLYEIILKYGLELTVPIEEKENFYSISGGTLLINLAKEINMEIIDLMCEEYKNLLEVDEEFKTTVILRDSSFKDDVDKINAMKKLEQVGIKEIRSI